MTSVTDQHGKPHGIDQDLRDHAVLLPHILLGALVIRLASAPFIAHAVDFGTFTAWGMRLAKIGPTNLWNDGYWCDYLPGYLYALWAAGELADLLPDCCRIVVFKLPNIAADVVTSLLILRVMPGGSTWKRNLIAAAYLINPAVLTNSTLWGQADSFHTAWMMGALALLVGRRPLTAATILGFACVVKPHTVVILPLVAIYVVLKGVRWWRIVLGILLMLTTSVAAFVPFNGGLSNITEFIVTRIDDTMAQYGYASVNAMNLWYRLGFNWAPDSHRAGGLVSLHQLGAAACVVCFVLILLRLVRSYRNKGDLALWESASLIFLTTFLLTTRAHERHVFPFFAMTLVVAASNRTAFIPYILVAMLNCVNLALSWLYILPGRQTAVLCPPTLGNLVCDLYLASLPIALLSFRRYRPPPNEEGEPTKSEENTETA